MASKKQSGSDPNHVVVDVRVSQDNSYKSVDRRTDSEWERRVDREWLTARAQRQFAASEMRSESQIFKGFDFGESRQDPSDVREAQEQCREWFKKSCLLRGIIRLRRSMVNYGFEVVPDKVKSKDFNQSKFNDWREEHEQAITSFARETLTDKYIMNNAVAFWRGSKGSNRGSRSGIITLHPERCKYRDSLGIPQLQVKLDWKADDFRIAPNSNKFLISDQKLKRYTQQGFITLSESEDEYFEVYKDDRVGWGFAWPDLMTLQHTLNQQESLEIGDRLWGFMCRLAERRHKMGHEIKQGPRAGLPIHFIKKDRATETLKFYQGRTGGIVDTANNFDQDIEFPFPSSDRFDKEKFASIWERISLWAGPVGLYLHALHTGKGSLPFVMQVLESEAEEDRNALRPYMKKVITAALRPPCKINLKWSNKIFQDMRQRQEAIKFLVAAGPLSGTTALREFGFDEEIEREFKKQESALAKNPSTKGQVFPIYDPAHGDPEESSGGRPAGQKDSGSRTALNEA